MPRLEVLFRRLHLRFHPASEVWLFLLLLLAVLPASAEAQVWRVGWGETRMIGDLAPGMDSFWKPHPPLSEPLHLEIFGGSTAPVGVDLTLRLVVLDHLLLSGSLGVGTYGQLLGDVAAQYGGEAARYVVTLVENGLFEARLGVGVRPFDGIGLELGVHYVLMHRASLIEASRLSSALQTQDASGLVSGALTVQGAQVELAWTFYVLEQLILRPSIGCIFALDAGASLWDGTDHRTDIEQTIESAVLTYGFVPTLSLSAGGVF